MLEIPGLVAAYLVTPAMNSCLTLVSFSDHCYAVPMVAMSDVPFDTWPIYTKSEAFP